MIWRSLAMLSCMEAFIFFAPGVATFLVLITHAAIHADRPEERLQIEEAYAVLGFVNVLVKTFNTFPRAIKGFDEARISFRRIERFLILPEANAAGGDSGTSSARRRDNFKFMKLPSSQINATITKYTNDQTTSRLTRRKPRRAAYEN